MKLVLTRIPAHNRTTRRFVLSPIVLFAIFIGSLLVTHGAEKQTPRAWRALPLITGGKVDPAWVHLGWGEFVVDNGALRTDCDPRGLGLLVYKPERFGNCQLRVVFKTKDDKSNAGVYVRIADGILEQAGQPRAALEREATGKPTEASMQAVQAAADREEGPWFAVHRGYEVQIAGGPNPLHRTGAIYSLAPSSAVSPKAPDEWKTMVITLEHERILVDLDGQRITSFDPAAPDLPPQMEWYEPKRESKRPATGYIGLQTHDPGDVVWFKEISVRPWPAAASR